MAPSRGTAYLKAPQSLRVISRWPVRRPEEPDKTEAAILSAALHPTLRRRS